MVKQKDIVKREAGTPNICGLHSYAGEPEKLAAHIAHELGNPLDGIRRYVGLALQQSLGEPLTREYLLKADKGIVQITRILHDLLIYSKQCHESFSGAVDVHSLIEKSLSEFESSGRFPEVSVQRVFSVEGPLYVEAPGLTIVLQNLFRNAAQAMDGRGVVTVATWRQNGSVGLAVQDTGRGIPESIKARIFDPFFSTKTADEGKGLGLALSKGIVARLGGTLKCENVSRPVLGARFTMILPRKSLNPGPPHAESIQT